jgi:SAM-dependent methyltransferase
VPEPSVSYGRIADRYESARGGQRRADEIVEAVAPWLTARGRVLEVGAGTGIVSATMAARGFDPFPIDISLEMLAQGAARFPHRRVNADAVRLPYRSGRFEAVVFIWSLHHISEPEGALQEAARVSRPGGCVVSVAGPVMEGPDDEIRRAHDRLNTALRPTRIAVARDTAAVGVAAGLRVAGAGRVRVTYDGSPNQAADAMEAGMYSNLWDLDAATWERVVRPVIDELRALPDPDVVRERYGLHPLVVFEV